jgi:hypothetical protein
MVVLNPGHRKESKKTHIKEVIDRQVDRRSKET